MFSEGSRDGGGTALDGKLKTEAEKANKLDPVQKHQTLDKLKAWEGVIRTPGGTRFAILRKAEGAAKIAFVSSFVIIGFVEGAGRPWCKSLGLPLYMF